MIKRVIMSLTALALLCAFAAQAQESEWAPEFAVGASIPDISSQDQNGIVQSFESLKGERGLIFLLSRSFDW